MRVRAAVAGDLAAIDALLAASYPVLLKDDYPPSVLVTALPIISRAQPRLVASGRYFVAMDDAGAVRGAGGWSAGQNGMAHVRHVVTDHRRQRQGIGRAILVRVIAEARVAGAARLSCLSTRNAVPFYMAMGFTPLGPRDVTLRPGIVFPSIEMARTFDDAPARPNGT